MSRPLQKAAVVAGATGGIGIEITKSLLNDNYRVYGIGRNEEKLKELEALGGIAVKLDLRDRDAVKNKIAKILLESEISILVNSVGYGVSGVIEEVPMDVVEDLFATNLFAPQYLTRQILPQMRARRSGLIINVGSATGEISPPMGGWYSATKFSFKSVNDAMRNELSPLGVKVVLLEPGPIDTEVLRTVEQKSKKTSDFSDYQEWYESFARLIKVIERNRTDPEIIGRLVLKIIKSRNPKCKYSVTNSSGFFLILNKIISDRLMDVVRVSVFKLLGGLDIKNFKK